MKTVHWTWSSRQKVDGKGEINLGKMNAVNNYCIALPSNEPRCTSCHAGYGWKDASFDFSKAENIDCLVCHDTTGNYKKFPTGAGHPTYEPREFPPKSGTIWQPPDLETIAKAVGLPSRDNCGACHFFGGGGDHVKHGDLDSSMAKPKRTMDVHMAVDGANMNCSACHRTENHAIPGKALAVSVSDRRHAELHRLPRRHAAQGQQDAQQSLAKVACQTCHIPTFARTLPTMVYWDWSTAGQDSRRRSTSTASRPTTSRRAPSCGRRTSCPYCGSTAASQRVLMGDKIDPTKVVHLNSPNGNARRCAAKITPFKVMKGKQPYDAGTNVIAVPHLSARAATGTWSTGPWP